MGRSVKIVGGGTFYKAVTNKCSHDSIKYSLASSLESYIHDFLDIYKKNIDLFLFASDFMVNKTEEFWGANTFKWRKLKNPVNVSPKPISFEKGSYGLYFGRLSDEKGVELILESLKNLPTIEFKVVGDGPLLKDLVELAETFKLSNVEFLGAKWGSELDDILYKAKYVVVPSLWYENFPYSILQSFVAGVPVIGSTRGGIPELIGDQRGLLFDPNNIASLTEAINTFDSDDELAMQMGVFARNYVEDNFSDELFYQNLKEAYTDVVNMLNIR